LSEELIYECVKCGYRAPASKWELVDVPGEFKCPECKYRVARKIRPPVVKRLKAV
jgi:DNA-directed RNA polymerase subunit RPC12/RpoP